VRWVDRFLLLLVACVVLASLAPLGAKLWWVLDLSTHFRVQYLAAATALLALAALRRQWLACAVLVAAGAVSALPVWPYLPLTALAATPAPSGAPLKVLSVNVSFRQFAARHLLEIIGAEAPDVLLVVEFTPHAQRVLADLDKQFPYRFALPAEGPYGIAIWSRYALDSVAAFQLSRVPAIDARVLGPSGPFRFLGVHLSAPTQARRAALRNEQLALLAKYRAKIAEPVIVAGDFNITPYSPYYAEWLAETALTDSRHGRSLSVSWPTSLPMLGVPIDHVAVSKEVTILGHHRLPNFNSDHFGIVAELVVGGEAP
jgi:endonuclease/exonuclease/phosphatase (EEP) superfamily protein YafD